MNYCPECMTVNGHHAHCPNAKDCNEKEPVTMKHCEYCDTAIHFDDDCREYPEDLPDDIPWPTTDTGGIYYHSWCFEKVVDEERSEIAIKHGAE